MYGESWYHVQKIFDPPSQFSRVASVFCPTFLLVCEIVFCLWLLMVDFNWGLSSFFIFIIWLVYYNMSFHVHTYSWMNDNVLTVYKLFCIEFL